MSKLLIKKISFGSFIKLCSASSFCIGLAMGLILFIISLFGGPVYANLWTIQYTGITAGIINIFLMPVLMAIMGIFFGIFAYLPSVLALKVFKGAKVRCEFEYPTSISSPQPSEAFPPNNE